MQRACVILNPEAGRGRGRRQRRALAGALAAAGVEHTIRETGAPGDERRLAAAAAREGWPVVLVAGGDGTVHGAVNGLLGTDRPTALGVVPLGTGNDYARLTRIPAGGVGAAVRALTRATRRRLDVGRADTEYFANSLGLGFGPAVLRQMQRLRGLRGFPLYLAAVVRAFGRFRPITVGIEAQEFQDTLPVMLVEVAVGTSAGGGFRLTPDADPADGVLDVCVIREVGWSQFLRYVPRVMRGTHGALPPVTLFRTRGLSCTLAAGAALEVHMDGELRRVEGGRVNVEIVPRRLEALCAA